MYNKYRTQFEVIHALEKEIGIPSPSLHSSSITCDSAWKPTQSTVSKPAAWSSSMMMERLLFWFPFWRHTSTSPQRTWPAFLRKNMSCGRPMAMTVQVSPSPAGTSWSNGGDCGMHITASVQTAKQEKGNVRAGKNLH